MAESTEVAQAENITAPVLPLELVFASALGAAAALIKDVSIRSFAVIFAVPIGYLLAKMGRWLVVFWVPRWLNPDPNTLSALEKRTRVYIADLRKELKNPALTTSERKLKLRFIQQFEEALQQRRLAELQIVHTSAPSPDMQDPK
ncbi:hypothetical protein [Hymenobacter baengnokdamensis]|uniref:hypothetical protein n=1 Tax=Hymenobacter baengnokdamensis TaxID=2615203 RepID=UPI001247D57C|nr:hypothetical protein [Hymenobacter baengnokdamensis]